MTLREKIEETNRMADAILRGDRFYELCVNKKDDKWRLITLPSIQVSDKPNTSVVTGPNRRAYAISMAIAILVNRTG